MRKVEINVFKFDDLTPEVQKKVLDKHRNFDSDFLQTELNERFHEMLTDKGYPNFKVWWSLSSSQGDGVAFEGRLSSADAQTLAKRLGSDDELVEQLYEINVIHTSRYFHEKSMSVEVQLSDYTEVSDEERKKVSELEAKVLEDISSLSKELATEGYSIIEHSQSDETIKENIEANEYEFYANGTIFRE